MSQPPDRQVPLSDGSLVSVGGATVEQQNQHIADLMAGQANRQGLAQFVEDFDDAIAALLSNNWDFLDAYSDRMWPGQNAAPDQWPQMPDNPAPTTLATAVTYFNGRINTLEDRLEILRTQLSFVSYAQTREARAFRLVVAVLAEQIKRDRSLTPPSDR